MSMSKRKEILLTQICACQDQDGWFAPLNVALRGVTAAQAIQRGKQTGNSIMGIVHHLVFWNERYLERFKQGDVLPLEISNAETFENNASDKGAEYWEGLQHRLDNLFTEWKEAVIECEDSKLDSRSHPDNDELWWTSLANLAIHNAYHIGQIVYIRKEQGLWKTWGDIG